MKSLVTTSFLFCSLSCFSLADVLYEDTFDNDGLGTNAGVGGGAANRTSLGHSWKDDGSATFNTNGTSYTRRALLYSQNTFQSDTGFKLVIQYTTGSLEDTAAHNLSFGLMSADTDVSSYSGFNPFKVDTSVYSIGANVTADGGPTGQGLNFANGTTVTTLDQSGTRAQFKAGETCEVTIEIGVGGYWCYRIDGEYEASGALPEGFDLSKNYRVVVYGQDDNGEGKSIQSVKLEERYALGERAAGLRGSWNGGQGDVENIKHLKTLGSTIARLNEGAVVSGTHNAPQKLLESIALGVTAVGGAPIASPVPTWGDLSLDQAENDPFLAEILEVRNAGIGVKVYSNSENFVGSNTDELEAFFERWKEYCDTDPEVQDFINSQPYHTGVWNRTTQQYDDASATYPYRKYMFCYAEFILKDYSLRYGKYVSSWIFDSADDMAKNGDNFSGGIIEEQRIFQAYANAVHAGNPEIPIAFNNGRSTTNSSAYPYAVATWFDDFTFGHAFGGNGDHAAGNQFILNYRYITQMTANNGFVHAGGSRAWDDLVVGNFHSKLGPISWQFSTPAAWEQDDFNQWNLEAMQAGGHTTWEGSVSKGPRVLRDWAIEQLELLDAHLAEFQRPGPPRWARKYTVLPDGVTGRPYRHVLIENEDFWDPEGDEIDVVWFSRDAPDWLTIDQDPDNPGQWIISGTPGDQSEGTYTFRINARDVNREAGRREVELVIKGSAFPVMESKGIELGASWNEIFPENGEPYLEYDNNATNFRGRAISYSTASYQTDGGFRLSVNYTTGNIGDTGAHNLSFGLIRDTLNFEEYVGNNPFGKQPEVYSLGVNVTEDQGLDLRGLNFTDGTTIANLDQSGTNVEFVAGESTEVVLEIGQGGVWEYSINGTTEASGTIPGGFDLTENYRIVVYGQDDNGGGKTLQSIKLQYLQPLNLDGYESWSLEEFNELGVDKSGDSDGDQLSNLLEYVLGGDPRTFDQDISPQMSSGIFSFSRRRDSVTDTEQQFQYSTDLQTWFEIDLSDPSSNRVTVEDLDGEMQKVEVSINPEWEEEGKVFTRLKVE